MPAPKKSSTTTSFAEGVRKWISVSEASESDLPPVEHRLPEDWDEEDILLDEDVAPIANNSKNAASKPAAPATVTSPKKAATAAAATDAAPGSPGQFPEGFFASPKNKKSADFPNNKSVAAPAKFNQSEEDARLKTNAAPGLIAKVAAFFMPKKDGKDAPVAEQKAAATASPSKLSGARRTREQMEASSSSSSESSDEDEIIEGASGDAATKISSLTAKQLESKITSDELKDYARENGLKFNSKAKKADLITLCKNFAKKQDNNNNTSGVVSSPRATSSSASPKKQQQQEAVPVPVAIVEQQKKKAPRKTPTMEQLTALPPRAVDPKEEPQPNWAVTQMKAWALANKVNLGDAILKVDILTTCWAAYDKKH